MAGRALPLIAIPGKTAVYQLGIIPSASNASSALLRFSEKGLNLSSGGGEGLAIVGDGEGRRRLVETLLHKHKLHPPIPAPGAFPYINNLPSTGITPIRHLTFARPSASGGFTDYTARYGALQEEDKQSLFEFYSELDPAPTSEAIHAVAQALRITHLLDVPFIGLSSGQTRRARIAAGLLTQAKCLLVEDPFAGLDIPSRAEIAQLLGKVNEEQMRMILVLRGKGAVGLPEWVSSVARVRDGVVWTGEKGEYLKMAKDEEQTVHQAVADVPASRSSTDAEVPAKREPLVQMRDVTVAYGEKKVLDNVSWSIYPGDRIHLKGPNGCGKTSILSILLGHHPRSYSMPAENLTIFSKPRRATPTTVLKKMIGHTSPEIFAAFPRNMGLSAGEAIGSGYEGVFSRRRLDSAQRDRILGLLRPFEGILSSARRNGKTPMGVEAIFETDFSHFPANQQAILLFLRSIVSRPPLLVLDEFSQTIDEQAWEICRDLLQKEWKEMVEGGVDQAVVVVSHYESEVPWKEGAVFALKDGRVEYT